MKRILITDVEGRIGQVLRDGLTDKDLILHLCDEACLSKCCCTTIRFFNCLFCDIAFGHNLV